MKQLTTIVALLTFCVTALQAQEDPQCNQEDWTFIYENQEAIINSAIGCYVGCLLEDSLEFCLDECLRDAYPAIADSCIACASGQVQCVLDNCAFPCLFPNSQNCRECVAENCADDYLLCVGDLDADGYLVEGGDCNNLDSLINPSEIDIPGDGIDQDCDGSDSLLTQLMEKRLPNLFRVVGSKGLLLHIPEQRAQLAVYDLTGREVYRHTFMAGDHQVPFSNLPLRSGIYIIQLRDEQGTLSEKVFIP